MGEVRGGMAPQPQPRADHAQTQQSEQEEAVKPQMVYHLVPLHSSQVNGGIPSLFQATKLSARKKYTTHQRVGHHCNVYKHIGIPWTLPLRLSEIMQPLSPAKASGT